ncbi:MAG: endonuclease [Bacteroidia bacterium]|nr:endonuclease [Bacteroidia bacterium]
MQKLQPRDSYRQDKNSEHAVLVLFVCLLMMGGITPSFSQERPFKVMCWNVENLFDTKHDSLKNDEEFLPEAMRHWTYSRYQKKLGDIAAVITAVGEWEPPALVGLCEVENEHVLTALTCFSPLKELGYRYVMTQSDDQRGIDVALLYQRDRFKLLNSRPISVGRYLKHRPTRDLLHVSGVLLTGDTLDLFICHLPSRSGGHYRLSEPYRLWVAKKLRSEADRVMHTRRCPQILIMGDFNDYPDNRSITEILQAQIPTAPIEPHGYYHLLAEKVKKQHTGSYKFQGEWNLLDHLIVSGTLLNPENSFFTKAEKAKIARLPMLLIEDRTFGGDKPFRTYQGFKYQGGISDHLPVYVDFTERIAY